MEFAEEAVDEIIFPESNIEETMTSDFPSDAEWQEMDMEDVMLPEQEAGGDITNVHFQYHYVGDQLSLYVPGMKRDRMELDGERMPAQDGSMDTWQEGTLPEEVMTAQAFLQIGSSAALEAELTSLEDVPKGDIHTFLLFDNSLSIPEASRAKFLWILKDLIAKHSTGERFTLALYDREMHVLAEESDDYAALQQEAEAIRFQNQDSFLKDALFAAFERAEQQSGYQRVVIFSDGSDDHALGYTQDELLEMFQSAGIPVHVIGARFAEDLPALANLCAFSRASGGACYVVDWPVEEPLQGAAVLREDLAEATDGIHEMEPKWLARVQIPPQLQDGSVQNVRLTVHTDGEEWNFTGALPMPFPVLKEGSADGALTEEDGRAWEATPNMEGLWGANPAPNLDGPLDGVTGDASGRSDPEDQWEADPWNNDGSWRDKYIPGEEGAEWDEELFQGGHAEQDPREYEFQDSKDQNPSGYENSEVAADGSRQPSFSEENPNPNNTPEVNTINLSENGRKQAGSVQSGNRGLLLIACALVAVAAVFAGNEVRKRKKARSASAKPQSDGNGGSAVSGEEPTVLLKETGKETRLLKNNESIIVLIPDGIYAQKIERVCKTQITIGRKESCSICIRDDTSVSGVHCVIFHSRRGEILVRDNHSSNGTFLNDQPLQEAHVLETGDILEIGRTRYNVQVK